MSLTTQQQMMTLAFVADIESGRHIINKYASEHGAKDKIDHFLKHTDGLTDWELVYGPALYSRNGMARNTTMIFYNKKESHMVLGVAGTNFIDEYDWFTEDIEVSKLVPWNHTIAQNGAANTGTSIGGYIAQGTATALKNCWNTSNHPLIGYFKHTPASWLKENLKKDKYKTTRISVTGHSLGGAIAPVFALAMNDQASNWNSSGNTITIDAYPYAGPTPGDTAFRDYAQGQITVHSTRNAYDVVPHAWQIDQLKAIHTLFDANLTQATRENNGNIIYWTIEMLVAKSQTASNNNHNYVRWTGEDVFTPNTLLPNKAQLEIEAPKMSRGLLDLFSKTTIDQLYNITGATRDTKGANPNGMEVEKHHALIPYMNYFCEFLLLLKTQHITEYHVYVIKSTALDSAMKQLFGKQPLAFDIMEGRTVLEKLIDTINSYYNANKPA